ncbi:ABC transporter substrate-binding protein [Sphingomonas mali]|uniref:ABC transporter substrate-binding protein n=1 Tax=Sphingomonas mali TaxID=40682 RepID=UPI001C3F6E55|nr:ABC transporter substrate-binding protein [Sphingomonas mali]
MISIGIGTQDATTNTAIAGIVIRKLGLLEKYLPHDGKYAGKKITVSWENFTSGPPITNGMIAGKLQLGVMGDYPLIVNGYTFAQSREGQSRLIAVAAYNLAGSGNGVVVNSRSAYYALADLKGQVVSVPFGSAAHGMLLRALKRNGLPADYLQVVNQAPEVGSTNLEQQKIGGHADFVPYPELLPHRGFARKIFDGAQIGVPTFHGVVVRDDFAKAYPEIVDAYLKAMMDAADWVRADPKRAAEKISEWTGVDKEVVYIYLGPGGIMTMDPTIKPQLVAAAREDVKTLQEIGKVTTFDVGAWLDDSYLRKVFAARGRSYEQQTGTTANYEVGGYDRFCNKPVTVPREAGEIWLTGGAITPHADTRCTIDAYNALRKRGQAIDVAYVFDKVRGIKLFADQAFYAQAANGDLAAFMLKPDADAFARRVGGQSLTFAALTTQGQPGAGR